MKLIGVKDVEKLYGYREQEDIKPSKETTVIVLMQRDIMKKLDRIETLLERNNQNQAYLAEDIFRIEKMLASLTDISVSGFKLVVVKPEEEMKE